MNTKLEKINNTSMIPDFLKKETIEKSDLTIDKEDIKISQLKLAHPISGEVINNSVKIGDFFDSLTIKNYGKEVEIIVVKHEKIWLKFNKSKKLIGRSNDGKFWDNGEKLSDEEKYLCFSHSFYVLIANNLEPFPLCLSFAKTSKREGDNLLNFLFKFEESEKKPIYSWVFKLTSEQVDGEKGVFCIKNAAPSRFVNKAEFEYAKKVNEMIKKASKIEVIETNVEEDADNHEDEITLD